MTVLTQISETQAQKATTANENFTSTAVAGLFGRNGVTTTALTWGYWGGTIYVDGTATTISDGTVALTASNTNYVEATRAGVVSANVAAFTAGRIPLYTVVTSGSAITSYTDVRELYNRAAQASISVSMTSADVTLSAIQARAEIIYVSGTLSGATRKLIVPAVPWSYIIYNNTSGSFYVVSASPGSPDVSVLLTTGMRTIVYCDGVNVYSALNNMITNVANTQVMYSSAGAIVGSANLTFDGTTLTAHTLTVSTGALTVPTVYGSAAANGDITIDGTSHATKTSSYVILQSTGGLVGIGTTTPQKTFVVSDGAGGPGVEISPNDAGAGTTRILSYNRSGSAYYPLATESLTLSLRTGTSGTERLAIDSAGAVTIPGTLSIGAATAPVISKNATYGLLLDATGAGGSTYGFGIYANGGGVIMRNAVATTNAEFPSSISVGGNITSVGGTLGVTGIITATAGVYIGAAAAANQIDDASNGAGSTTLYIGNATITVSSDERLKRNIKPLEDGLSIVKALAPIEYDQDDERPFGDVEHYVGFGARHTHKIAPWSVHTQGDTGLMWKMRQEFLMAPAVRAIQQLEARLAALEARQ